MYDPGHSNFVDFEALFHAAPTPCLILTPQLQICAVNESYLQATLTQRSALVGRHLFDAFPDDPADPAADGTKNLGASLQRVIASRRSDHMPVQRYPIRRPDGSFELRYWRPGNHPLLHPDGGLRYILHHVEDVTRQMEAEKAFQALALEPGSALPAIFDGMFEGVQIIDRESRYVYVNETAAAHGHRSRAELLGKRMQDAYPGIESTEMHRHLQACLLDGKGHQMVNEFSYPDGSRGWFELRIEPVPGGALILSSDITRRVDLEDALRSAERLESVGRLAGGIAHDFNNLVTIICGYASLLQNSLPEADPRSQELAQILAASERAGELTRQLLAFSRKQVMQPKILDLNSSVKTVVTLLQRVIGEDISVEVKLTPDLDPISADPGQVEQIIMNLALNARDAMAGGGKLTLETAHAVLDEAYVAQHSDAKAGPHVMLAVSDTGHGMDADTQRRIFEPFFTTKQMGRGTGLGLSTVYGIVKQSGGNIWVYSEPGKGTCFKVYLPAQARAGAQAEPTGAQPQALTPGSGCILLVEDEEGVRRLFETVLRTAGYHVVSAKDPAQALEACRQHAGPIDLLLTDVVMPGIGGKQLAEEVAKLRPGIKVVFMSGYTDNAIVHQGVLEAGTAFISKPVSPSKLLEVLRGHLGGPNKAA